MTAIAERERERYPAPIILVLRERWVTLLRFLHGRRCGARSIRSVISGSWGVEIT